MARNAKDLQLVLHIGMHKTATTYLQNVFSARRYDLASHGVLYPNTGIRMSVDTRTRDGAQSGHAYFTGRSSIDHLMADLLVEVPPNATTVLMSSEDFSRTIPTPEEQFAKFSAFGSVKVVLVLRRQDVWIESFYKQIVDQYGAFETRSFGDYVAEEGPRLLDYYTRFSPWRDLVGPENFHVLSYDDLADGAEIGRRILQIAGVDGLEDFPGVDVPRYDSVRGIDTLGLRILNGFHLPVREIRDQTARSVYGVAPKGDVELMTPELRKAIQERYAAVNERIEAEWFDQPVPGLRFGKDLSSRGVTPPSNNELLGYTDQVIALCEAARVSAEEQVAAELAALGETP